MQHKTQKAFIMVELIFAIVIISILASVAVPKFANTTTAAYRSKAESTVAALRSAIATERQKLILRGQASSSINTTAAEALLTHGLDTSWTKKDATTFTYTAPDVNATCSFKIVGGKLEKQTCASTTGLSHL